MKNKNIVYIAASMDGYISDRDNGLEWLNAFHEEAAKEGTDLGYGDLMSRVDALIMGRKTFETVCGFGIEWPYTKPVFVLSRALEAIPEKYQAHAQLVAGALTEVLDDLHSQGYHNLYIDGGTTIQSFLKEDLIDELIVTTFPVLLGGGASLFADLPRTLDFRLKESKVFFGQLVQNRYVKDSD